MPECDTRFPGEGLVDATSTIEAHVNRIIANARRKGLKGATLVDTVYKDLGKSVSSNILSKNFNVSSIEKWAKSLAKDKVYPLKVEQTKYKGVTYRAWDNSAKGYDRVLSPTLEVTGKGGKTIFIGLDKLGHFAQQGYTYWEMVARKGKSLTDAKEHGHQSEAAMASITEIYGLQSTGVYSLCDLEANLQGYKFYKWLETTGGSARFRLADYVSKKWNEEAVVNSYAGTVAKQVWRNLLAADWAGGFSIKKEGVSIALNCKMAVTGQKVKSEFKYTYKDGPVSVPFNGNLSFIPFVAKDGSLGYRGIRIDMAWSSGEFWGRAQLYANTSENRLKGTWGWYKSESNGGLLELKRGD